jgi:nucleoside-diphosphate-sugar epimerase
MNVLITGPSGFVGKNLVEYLSGDPQFSVVPQSIRSSSIFDFSADCYVHLAGKAHDISNKSANEEYMLVNYELTRALYDHFLVDEHANCFVFVSSIKAVADTANNIAIKEETEAAVETIYGISKRKAEDYIMSNLPGPSKRVYILRPCMIHGPGNKGNLNLLFKMIKTGIPYPLAAFHNERSFLSIENLCFVIREILSSDRIAPGIYNLSDDTPLSTNEVINIISSELGRKPRLMAVNPGLIKVVAKIGDYFRLPLNSKRLQKLTESYVVDNTKIRKALGRPFPVNALEGLRRTIRSFRKN